MLTLKIQIINFEIIHAQCRGQPRASSDKYFQTVTQEDVKKCLKRIKKKVNWCVFEIFKTGHFC